MCKKFVFSILHKYSVVFDMKKKIQKLIFPREKSKTPASPQLIPPNKFPFLNGKSISNKNL